mgnify:CR=1 FL=1
MPGARATPASNWHGEPLPAPLYGAGPGQRKILIGRRGDLLVWARREIGWHFCGVLTPGSEQIQGEPIWRLAGSEEETVPKITKASALWQAERVEQEIDAPGPGGVPVTIARPGDWVCYAETSDGELVFKGFLSDGEYREKFVRVTGGNEALRR